MDDNNNGVLDKAEFRKGMRELGLNLAGEEETLLFSFLDKDRSGDIDFEEFLTTIRGNLNARREKIVVQAFAQMDKNGNGVVEPDDVIGTLAEYSQTIGEPGPLFQDEITPEPFLIVSGDHDFKQLQKFSNVKQYAPAQKKWVKITEPAEVVLREHIIIGDKGDGIPNMLSADNVFVNGTRQTPIRKVKLNKWKNLPPEEWVTGEMSAGYVRNSTLVDLTKTPEDIKETIINSYKSQQGQDRSLLLNYFMKHKMSRMIDVIDDF